MKKLCFALATLLIFCSLSVAGGMKYLTQQEFAKYDEMLKNNGRPDLKTVVAVYEDWDSPPRIGLKCVNKKGQQFQVYIVGSKIIKIDKIDNH